MLKDELSAHPLSAALAQDRLGDQCSDLAPLAHPRAVAQEEPVPKELLCHFICCSWGLAALACCRTPLWCVMAGKSGAALLRKWYSHAPRALPGLQEGLMPRAGQVDRVHLHRRQAACASQRCTHEALSPGNLPHCRGAKWTLRC